MTNSKMKTKVRLVNNADDRIVGKRVDAMCLVLLTYCLSVLFQTTQHESY